MSGSKVHVVSELVVIQHAVRFGDPKRLTQGFDSWGNTCGEKNEDIDGALFPAVDATNLRYVYYYITAAITSTVIPSIKVCVRACPYELINIGEQDKVFDLSENEDIHLCRYDVMRSSAPLVRQVHVVEEEDDEVPTDDVQQNDSIILLAITETTDREQAGPLTTDTDITQWLNDSAEDDVTTQFPGDDDVIKAKRSIGVTSSLDAARYEQLKRQGKYAEAARLAYQNVDLPTIPWRNLTCPILPIIPHKASLHVCIPDAAAVAPIDLDLDSIVPSGRYKSPFKPNAECESSGTFLDQMLRDIYLSWPALLTAIVLAFTMSVLLTILMRFYAAWIVYSLLVLFAIWLLVIALYQWSLYAEFDEELKNTPKQDITAADEGQKFTYLLVAVMSTGLLIAFILLLACYWKSIALVVQLFVEASHAIKRMPMLLLQPVGELGILLLVTGMHLVIVLYIYTSSVPKIDNATGVIEWPQDEFMFYMQWYFYFGVIWIYAFIEACADILIAGAVTEWYFARENPHNPISTSLTNLIRYHLGSAALGSLLIAICRFLRLVLTVIQRECEKRGNIVAVFIVCCCKCCLRCLEEFLKYMTRIAYVVIMAYGCNLCTAAKTACEVMADNIARFGALHFIALCVINVAKMTVMIPTVWAAYALYLENNDDLCFIEFPFMLMLACAILVADVSLDVLGMTVNAIFICFCIDCQTKDGKTKPYYMSLRLMMYVDKELARKLLEKQNSERRKSGLPELEMEPDYVPASMEEDQKRRKMEKREERREQGLPSESEEEVESVEETRPEEEHVEHREGEDTEHHEHHRRASHHA